MTIVWFYQFSSQIYKGNDRTIFTMCHFYPKIGLKLEYSGFSCNQHQLDSSGTCILWSEHNNKHAWNSAWGTKMDAFCLCFFSQKINKQTNTPYMSPVADKWQPHYMSGIQGPRSPLYICGSHPSPRIIFCQTLGMSMWLLISQLCIVNSSYFLNIIITTL